MGTRDVNTADEPSRPATRARTARDIEVHSSVRTECRAQEIFGNLVLQKFLHRQTSFRKNTVLISQGPECSELACKHVSSIFRINYRTIEPDVGHTKTNPRCRQCETLHHAIP